MRVLLELRAAVERVHELGRALADAEHIAQPQLAQAQQLVERIGARAPLGATARVGSLAFVAAALLGRQQLELAGEALLQALAGARARGPGEVEHGDPGALGCGTGEPRPPR